MRRLAILVSVALLTVVGITATTQAYYLDAPHNESNGIYCYNCHSMSYWRTPPTGGIDVTTRNAVCLQCHAEGAIGSLRGPSKKLHASSTTSTKFGTWTTECTQCHNVHYQGQLDWATTDSAQLYLATGTLLNEAAPGTPGWAADPASPVSGATTFNISGITAQTGWDDTTKWFNKGGLIPEARATDSSRGLVLVPNIAATGNYPAGLETYEIMSATPTSVKVKGRIKTTSLTGKTFGVIYGQALKSIMPPNGATSAADMRNVKFFKPTIIAGAAGGYIDNSGAAVSQGLCEVCHTDPLIFSADGGNIGNHKAGAVCNSCHNVVAGGSPEVIKIHTTYITDDVGGKCVGCHVDYTGDPDSGHINGCDTCHVSVNPNLTSNSINNTLQVINETVGIFSLNALLTAGYTYNEIPVGSQARVRDADGTDINGVGGNLSFTMITCGTCHVSKPGKVDNGTHGGHPDTDFVWSAGCADLGCHGPNTLNIVKNIHGNGTVGTCTMCHDPTSVAAGNYTVRREGDPTFGIDGTAVGMTRLSTCLNCHSVNTPGVVHHTSKNNYAGLGNCTTYCHNVSGHTDHAAELATYVNCNSCHADVVGSASGAPVETVADPKKHDSCQTCHTNLGGLKTKAGDYPTSTKIIALPAGGTGSGDGGGTCFACHGDYFATHTHSHAASVTTTSLCGTCHTTLVGNTVTDAKTHVNRCVDCHDMVTGARVNGSGASTYLGATNVGDATVNAGAGGTCATCHTAYFNGHIHAHAFTTVDAACALCHGATPRTGSTAYKTVTTPYTTTGEVHGVSSCGTCHELTTGALKGSAVGKTITTTTCIGCHAATWTVMHTIPSVTHTTHVINTTGSCDTCHGNPTPATSDARDAVATPFMGAGEVHTTGCAACHNADGSNRTTGLVKANTVARGNCAACHTTAWNVIHATTTISHNVTGVTLCNTCHSGDTVSATATHKNACADCHNLTTGARVDGSGIGTYLGATNVGDATVNSGGGGTCSACHAGYFTSHLHNHANFTVTASCATNCHAATDLATSNARYAATSPWTAVGQVHATGCGLCHDLTVAGALKGSAVGKLNTASCVDCHTPTWTVMHTSKTGVSHATRVDALSTCTSTCHTATAGGASGLMPVDPGTTDAANKVHDYCTTCHTVAGAMIVGNTTYGALPIVKGDCGTCHGAAYFNSHIHTHTIVQGATDLAQASPGQLCSVCHVPSPSGLITWASVYAEHLSSCSKCHSEPRAEVTGTITAGVDPTRCLSCHSTKTQPATHGGHSGDFAHTGGDCATTCHPGANVVADVHGNTCGMCHTDGAQPTRLNVGPVAAYATFGIDGDADGATGAYANWAGFNCLSCHTAGANTNNFSSTGGIHHVNKSSNVTCTTAACHTASKLTHTTSVATDSTCNSCHDNAAGGSARNAITAPFIGTGTPNEVHYKVGTGGGCDACHTLQAAPGSGGILRTTGLPANLVLDNGLSEAWVNGTNGGGNCSACHKGPAAAPYFDSHAAIDHTAFVSATGLLCVDCHAATAGTALTVPCAAGDNKKHDSCATCHLTTTGLLKSKAVDYPASTRIETISAGTNLCTDCHGVAYFSNTRHSATHDVKFYYDTTGTGANVDVMQNNGTDGCAACHDDAAAALATFAAINTEHLNDCNKCHTETRDINETSPTGTSVRTWIAAKSAETTTDTLCRTCHYPNWWNNPTHTNVDHVALGKVTNSAQCTGCHDKNSVGNDAQYITTIHSHGCGTCHVNPLGGGPLVNKNPGLYASQTKNYETLNPTGGTCIACHDAYGTNFQTAHWNDTHATRIGTTASCVTCHTGNTISSTLVHKNTCTTCHTNVTTDGRLLAGTGAGSPFGATAVGDATLHAIMVNSTCATCHVSRASTFTSHLYTTPHSNLGLTAGCTGCHTGDIISSAVIHNNTCTTCHLNTTTDGSLLNGTGAGSPYAATAVGTAAGHVITAISYCANCHSARATDFTTHLATTDHDGLVATAASETPSQSDDCNDCHTKPVVSRSVANTHNSNCLDCHTNITTNGTLVNGGVNAGSYGGTATNIGSATGHTLGAATSTCITCHVSTYFSNTSTPKHGSATHGVAIDGDLSNGQTCSTTNCHAGQSENWANILARHDLSTTNTDVCKVCHDSTRTTNVVSPRTSVQNVITNNALSPATIVSCLECHADKSGTHGGHATDAFAWTTNSKTSCGGGTASASQGCHDWYNNQNVVTDVHGSGSAITGILGSSAYRHYSNNACRNCHSVNGGGDGNTIGGNGVNGYTGDARIIANGGPANATTHTEECATCHTLTIPRIHHERWMSDPAGRNVTPTRPNWVLSGNCYKCHSDANYVDAGKRATFEPEGPARTQVLKGSTNATEKRPGIAPCAFCHIENTTGGSGVFRIKKYLLSNILVARASNVDAPNPFTNTYTHSIPNRGTPINVTNSGNCLHCHGSLTNRPVNYPNPTNTKALGRAVKPRHAWVVAMISGNEKDAAEQPRIRMGLHPGHQRYRLMGTQPSPAANNVPNPGRVMNDRLADGKGNEKLYNIAGFDKVSNGAIANSYAQAPKDIGKTTTANFTNFQAVWGTGGTLGLAVNGLRSYLGTYFTPVATQSVPYTINGDVGGPYAVPVNP